MSVAPPAARRAPRAEARSSSFKVDDEIGAIRAPCSARALHVPCLDEGNTVVARKKVQK